MKRITVLGTGNILLTDEGFGVRVVEELQQRYCFPEGVQVLDGGTLGMELLQFISGSDKLLLIDAIAGDGPPGSFYHLAGDAVQAYFSYHVSLHDLGMRDVLAALELTGQQVDEVVVLGVEPASLDFGLELTPVVAAAVESTVQAALGQLALWQVEVTESD